MSSSFDYQLIGIDGGATEAKAHLIQLGGSPQAPKFSIGPQQSLRKYERVAGFQPVPVADQFKQRDEGTLQIGDAEREQAENYISASAEVVKEVLSMSNGPRRVLIGIGMPGLKTPDGRGINVINNGPRMPHYLARLEELLKGAGVDLVKPIARLGSDADYCGIGEEYAEGGAFRGVANAYYAGLGTGVADAMKLHGKLVTFDQSKEWIQKSWQLMSSYGVTFEKIVSAKSMNVLFASLLGREGDSFVNVGRFPQDDAVAGGPVGKYVMHTMAAVLAELLFERVVTITKGRHAVSWRGPAYAALKSDHPFVGTFLDRVVIGQRLGMVYADAKYAEVFRKPLDEILAAIIAERGEDDLKKRHLKPGTKKPELVDGFVYGSTLRAAPAVGAAVAAYEAAWGPVSSK